MRAYWVLVLVVACSKSKEAPKPEPAGSGSAVVPAAPPVSIDAAPVVEIDAAPPEPPPPPAGKTNIKVLGFEGMNVDKLPPLAQAWIGWIEQHFNKCELDEKTEHVTTTATLAFKGGTITFDLPKVPDALAACIKKNVETPYLGYEPVPPKSLGKTTIKVKLEIGEQAPPPPPDASPVKHVASKIKGARDKKELGTWLDDNVVRKLKPCIEDSAMVVDLWKIGFEIDAAGAIGKVTAPDPNVVTCVEKAVAGVTAAKAGGANTVELVYSAK